MPHTHEPRATHALPQTHRRQNERQQRVCQDSEVRVLISDDLLEEDKLEVFYQPWYLEDMERGWERGITELQLCPHAPHNLTFMRHSLTHTHMHKPVPYAAAYAERWGYFLDGCGTRRMRIDLRSIKPCTCACQTHSCACQTQQWRGDSVIRMTDVQVCVCMRMCVYACHVSSRQGETDRARTENMDIGL